MNTQTLANFQHLDQKKSHRYVLILSDIEMGAGGERDDFPHTYFLKKFVLDKWIEVVEQRKGIDSFELVLNGDIFDFLKTSYRGEYPHLIDAECALEKFQTIASCHQDFFLMLKDSCDYFQELNKKTHRNFEFKCTLIVGNHDIEWLFPEVQQAFLQAVGDQEYHRYFSVGKMNHTIGDAWIEHGQQQDSLFVMPEEELFVQYEGKKILNTSWASVALLNVLMPLQPTLYHLDRIKPKKKLFEHLPELKELMLSCLWQYWTKDYFHSKDPLKRVNWTMIKEIIRRSTMFNPDIEFSGDIREKMMDESSPYRVFILGHRHEPHLASHGNRRMLQSGCWRSEYMLEDDETLVSLPKSYIELWQDVNGRTLVSELKDVYAPDVPLHYIPGSLKDLRPRIQNAMGSYTERLKSRFEIEAQELKEKFKK